VSFTYTGEAQTWTVPAGVNQATFDVYGAQGGSGYVALDAAGKGGRGTATLAVTPGEKFQINVGGRGGDGPGGAGGFNGGGTAGTSTTNWDGGGGGGASDVRRGGVLLADRIIVAGGGGGNGFYGGGGGAEGTDGNDGGSSHVGGDPGGGGRGTNSAVGSGGNGGYYAGSAGNGADGTLATGGSGGNATGTCCGAGGGGGGGYYGGGGGGGAGSTETAGGGGGGSGYGPDGVVFQTGARAGAGLVTITTDTTPPTTTTALAPATPNGQNDWYVSKVHATVSAADEPGGSGVSETRCALDPVTVPVSFADLPAGCAYTGTGADVTADGQHVLYAASKDNAGNTETPVKQAFKLDATRPAVTCATAPSFRLNQADATVTASVSDATSGPVQTQVSAAADTGGVGAKTANVTGKDLAGKQTTSACAYSVGYGFAGFFQPVDNLDANGNPVLNVVKAGQAIPLKWRLTDATGAPVTTLSGAQITVAGITCSLDTTADQLEEVAAGASGLQSLGDGNYQLNWKSPTSYANSCKRLRLDLGDGSSHPADFKFTK